jgi:hypothetical protein
MREIAAQVKRMKVKRMGYDSLIVRTVLLARTLWLNWAHKRAG